MRLQRNSVGHAPSFECPNEVESALTRFDVLIFDTKTGIIYQGNALGGDSFKSDMGREAKYFLGVRE